MSFREILGRKQPGYIFGGNTGETYEGLQSRRKAVERMALGSSAPRTAGEGLSFLGQALAHRALSRKEDAARQEGQNEFKSAFQRLLGGGAGMPAGTPFIPQSGLAAAPGGDMASRIRQGLTARGLPEHVADAFILNFQDESGLNPGINEQNPTVPGSRGGFGLAQWTGPRRRQLEAFAGQRGTSVSDVDTQLDFLVSELQGSEAEAAKAILAAQDTGTAADAIVRRFLRPAEEHRERRSTQYLGGAQPNFSGAPTGGTGLDPNLVQLLDNPHATNGQKAIMQLMLQRQIAASAPPDPMQALQMRQAQLGIERSQLELDRLRNPSVDPMQQIELERAQVELEQLRNPQPETTDDIREYQFAQQNGFEGSFSDFIRGNRRAGASSVNVSTGTGLPTPKAGFDYVPDGEGGVMRDERGMPIQAPIPGGPEDTSGDAASLAASASDSLALIDNVLNDPNLASVTGMIQGRLPARTQAQQDLLIRIEQLQGQAFLQAFETLKGGGQITEREGQAAQAAIARLQRPQSEDAYRQALTELRAIVARGAERAGGAAQQPSGTPAGPTHRFNAETGQIEEITQ